MTTKIHITTGLPASGKTTFARTLDAMRFNLDDFRAMMGITPDTWSREKEDIAIASMIDAAKNAIKAGFDIVLDNTHLHPRLPKMYRKEFGHLDVDFIIHDFTNVDVQTCILRDALRENCVGHEVIERMAKTLEESRSKGWKLTAEWITPTRGALPAVYIPDTTLPTAIIVDIDGTVALHPQRSHYDYSQVSTDSINVPVHNLVARLMRLGETNIIFVSGRDDNCRDDTEKWLMDTFFLAHPPQLFMRETGDRRPDFIIKGEIFDAHIRNNYNVEFCIDDRNQVVNMWRSIGITCLQVADGDF